MTENILNTENSKTRDDALNKIIQKMNKSLIYKPIAYKYEGSGCSCCLSEYFYLICKIKDKYKIFCYNGYINHTKECAIIRCTCDNPFIWKNIIPKEENIVEICEIYFTSKSTSIQDDNWIYEFKEYVIQEKENDAVFKYNENEDDKKNYLYYFTN